MPAPTPTLSPSRAGAFLDCPLLFRYRTVDRLPEPPSPAAVRGTLVHGVLERVFDLPAAERLPAAAHAALEPAWVAMLRESREAREVRAALPDEAAWLATAHEALDRWFALEDPTRLEPAEREAPVEARLASGLVLRGIVDRIDVAPDGSLRVVDYKTGSAPREGFEARALFQLRIYALVLWRARGVVPRRLQLVYLGDGQVVSQDPDEADLEATERKVDAVAEALATAHRTGAWTPRRGPACGWCPHHAHCPLFGGTLLPLPPPRRRTDAAGEPAPAPALATRLRSLLGGLLGRLLGGLLGRRAQRRRRR